mmetsp:Transcript_63926/g.125845  ORF Transcript_63926/g.125845 Transcript_63926/m.125845 type:complete len:214 (+) Transcript_63926:87-728(+)
MALLASRARLALRASGALRSSEHLSSYSAVGPFSVFSTRQRYTIMLKAQTDPTLADFFYEKFLHAWFGDAPSYNYWFVTQLAMGAAVGIVSRHLFFNPDVYGRQQEVRKPMPDRHRQWAYSLPYYNHRMRNFVTKYKFALIDNEPDYSDFHPVGYRPNRKQIHRRPYMWVFSIPRYTCQDPLFTSVTHANMNRIYEEIGYQKKMYAEFQESED